MKKLSILIILSVSVFGSTYACEICGCGHSNFQIGLLPNFNKGFMGFRYGYSSFRSHVKSEPSEFSNDRYQTMELWGGYNFKRLQIMTFVPYIISHKESDNGVTRSQGIGDWMVLVNYKIVSSTALSKNEKTPIRHEIYLGGGIKLPTGLNQVNTSDPGFNIGDFNSQAGTGSVDYILNATHNLLWGKSGIVTNIAYRMNTANEQEYKFGNRSYISSSYYYSIIRSETKILPNAGISFQSNNINTYNGVKVEDSNGYTLNSTLGLNILRDKIGFNAIAFIPLTQNNYDGQTKFKSRILLGVTYSF